MLIFKIILTVYLGIGMYIDLVKAIKLADKMVLEEDRSPLSALIITTIAYLVVNAIPIYLLITAWTVLSK